MTHDFSLVFDIESPYWQKVLEIFENNEKYEKKIVSNRNLHHKFPRSFSKKLGEPVDNDKDNLISLSLADHFLVHYYYYLLAKKGYRQAMATAFTFMARKSLKYITPETAEAMANDYAEAKCIADQGRSERMTGENHPMYGKTRSLETIRKISEAKKGKKQSAEHRLKNSLCHKGIKASDETRNKISEANKGKHSKPVSEETRRKMSEAKKGKQGPNKGKKFSAEARKKMSESRKKYLANQKTKITQ